VQKILGAGRSTVFGLIKAKRLRSIKVGRKRIVSDQSLRQFIAEQESDAEQEPNRSKYTDDPRGVGAVEPAYDPRDSQQIEVKRNMT
jgi:excisionase family DNA binding protein